MEKNNVMKKLFKKYREYRLMKWSIKQAINSKQICADDVLGLAKGIYKLIAKDL